MHEDHLRAFRFRGKKPLEKLAAQFWGEKKTVPWRIRGRGRGRWSECCRAIGSFWVKVTSHSRALSEIFRDICLSTISIKTKGGEGGRGKIRKSKSIMISAKLEQPYALLLREKMEMALMLDRKYEKCNGGETQIRGQKGRN